MRSTRGLAATPAGVPLRADDILEFHAARILLLFAICGTGGRIDSLTKLAKLDFFVRYPDFFRRACQTLGLDVEDIETTVESAMVRHHYGPWDKRYYQVLGYLEARGLIQTTRVGRAFNLTLTPKGKGIASQLRMDPNFAVVCGQMKRVKKVFGQKSGASIKNLIYRVFEKEVALLRHGESITKSE
ncbi:MAG TPA: hypothetical protein VJU77_18945 [Chthoniobacterales bacterium]|nr:hypothetical protein [Chthoniobacterales bacterium]